MTDASVKALIFDVDGTLAETEEYHRQAFNETFAAAGLSWVWDKSLYVRLLKVTGGKERIAHYIASAGAEPVLDQASIASLHRDKTARFAAHVANGGVELRPGVKRLLTEAREAGVRLAVATTTTRQNVTALLDATLGYDPFEVIAAGDDVSAKKPAPDVYVLALQRLGLDAKSCVAIEDTLNGYRSATEAGLPCLVTRSVYGERDGYTDALAVVDDLDRAGGDADGPFGLREIIALHAVHGARGRNG